MTTIKELVNRGCVETFRRVSIKRLKKDQTFESEWYDITYNVVAFPKVSQAFGDKTLLGDYKITSSSITLDNSGRKYNSENDMDSIFYKLYFRRLTKVKIEVGYIDDNNAEVEGLVFYGIFYGDPKASDKQTITIPMTGMLKVFDLFGAKGIDETATDTETMVTRLYGKEQNGVNLFSKFFEGSSINPDSESVISLTNASVTESDTVWDKIQDYSNYEDFIPYVNNSGEFVWDDRDESASVEWVFNGQKLLGNNDFAVNVISLNSIDDGISNYYSKAVIEYDTDATVESKINWTPGGDSTVDQYGERIYKRTALELVKDDAKTFADKIINNYQAARKNFKVVTPFIPIEIKNTVQVNVAGNEINDVNNCFRVGISTLDSGDVLQGYDSSINLISVYCKVVQIDYDINNMKCNYILREI